MKEILLICFQELALALPAVLGRRLLRRVCDIRQFCIRLVILAGITESALIEIWVLFGREGAVECLLAPRLEDRPRILDVILDRVVHQTLELISGFAIISATSLRPRTCSLRILRTWRELRLSVPHYPINFFLAMLPGEARLHPAFVKQLSTLWVHLMCSTAVQN